MAVPLAYTITEVARFLGIGRSTAYRLVQRGELPATKVGARLRVGHDALIRYLEGESK